MSRVKRGVTSRAKHKKVLKKENLNLFGFRELTPE